MRGAGPKGAGAGRHRLHVLTPIASAVCITCPLFAVSVFLYATLISTLLRLLSLISLTLLPHPLLGSCCRPTSLPRAVVTLGCVHRPVNWHTRVQRFRGNVGLTKFGGSQGGQGGGIARGASRLSGSRGPPPSVGWQGLDHWTVMEPACGVGRAGKCVCACAAQGSGGQSCTHAARMLRRHRPLPRGHRHPQTAPMPHPQQAQLPPPNPPHPPSMPAPGWGSP